MRYKRRYICVEIVHPKGVKASTPQSQQLKQTNLNETILNSTKQFYGDYGLATIMPSYSIIYFNTNTNISIIRTSREMHKKFLLLLSFIKKIDQFESYIRVLHSSGSIKKCKKYLIEYDTKQLLLAKSKQKQQCKNELSQIMSLQATTTATNETPDKTKSSIIDNYL